MRRTLALLSLTAATLLALGGAAEAQTTYQPGPETLGEVIVRTPPSDGAQTLPVQTEQVPDEAAAGGPVPSRLPVTGGDVVALAAVGGGAVVVGGGLLLYRRRSLA